MIEVAEFYLFHQLLAAGKKLVDDLEMECDCSLCIGNEGIN